VLRNYDTWHARLFDDPELAQVLATMAAANRAAIDAVLTRWADAGSVGQPPNAVPG